MTTSAIISEAARLRREHPERVCICPLCTREFVAPTAKSKYCSRACRDNAKKSPIPESIRTLWYAMISRCHNPKNKSYRWYGARGITVCDEWQRSMSAFFQYMGKKPTSQHSLDRIDGTKGYEPGNVRWATKLQQARNQCTNRIVEAFGEKLCVSEWAVRIGIPSATIIRRLDLNWAPEHALTKRSYERGSGNAKLTLAQVAEIRRRYEQGERSGLLAAEFSVNQSAILRLQDKPHPVGNYRRSNP